MQAIFRYREEGLRGLREGRHLTNINGQVLLSYLTIPPFHNPIIWNIVKDHQNNLYTVFYTEWHQEYDPTGWLFPPVGKVKVIPGMRIPGIHQETYVLDANVVESILSGFEETTFPLSVPRSERGIVLDSVAYELKLVAVGYSITIQWCHALPDQWQSLQTPLTQLIAVCESLHGTM